MKARWRTKYGNIKVKIDGHNFDSKKEGARRYRELLLLAAAGEIQDLEVHPRYEIIPGFVHQGTKYQHACFTPDFRYRDKALSYQIVVEDVKPWVKNGMLDKKTRDKLCKADYVLRKKLFLMQHPEIVFKET